MNAKPFLLRPAGKDYLWGGERLNTEFHKNIPLTPLAETWECSAHPDGPSLVASGPDKGKPLPEVLARHPEWLGTHPLESGLEGLPVLIKFIDAKRDLSVQVHPDDAFARRHEHQPGKTELWYVVDAAPGATLVYGFARDMTPARVRAGVEDGGILKDLQFVPVSRGDVFFVEPGTVHAIGAGVLLAEIQQSSNVTYRLYDYGRLDKNGASRPLHLERALQVMNLRRSEATRQQMRVLRYQPGAATELLCRCRYFQTERLLLSGQLNAWTGGNSFQVYLCTRGEGSFCAAGVELPFGKGECLFVPAGVGETRLSGQLEALRVSC